MRFDNSVTRVEAVVSWRPGSVGDSRPLEVARAVVVSPPTRLRWHQRLVAPLGSGVMLPASSVRSILIRRGLPPAAKRGSAAWRRFLRQQAAAMLACDFLTVQTVWLTRIYVLFFVSLERRVEFVASTANSNGGLSGYAKNTAWVAARIALRTPLTARAIDPEPSFRRPHAAAGLLFAWSHLRKLRICRKFTGGRSSGDVA
jgi:hypothetical protein